MAEFYPSEIARLVLGYLKEVQCLNSWQSFLDESSDLQEHKRLYKEGKFCTTNVNGKSLLDILAEYCTLKNAANENNQRSCSSNSYQIYGVYKTPNKVNESTYASFRINQKIQTQSVVSANRSTTKSPSGRCNLFTSPTSRPESRTPRRRLECKAVNLDFGAEVDSGNVKNISNLSASKRALFSCITASTNQSCKRKILVATDNRSESEKKSNDDEIAENKTRENVHLSSPDNPKTHVNSSTKTAAESDPYNVQCPSVNSDNASNTPNSKSSEIESFHQHSELETRLSAASPLQNVMYQTSNIITNAGNVSVSLMQSCSTPQYEVDPPPYNRAPNTNSPRIVLSYDRSLLPSLTTPVKDKKAYTEEEWSPKRKGCIPRRRLLSESPMSKLNHQSETVITFDSMIESLFAPDEVLFNDPLVQLLTENINKVKQCELKESDLVQEGGLNDIVKKAAEYTEEDPAFERFLNTICGNGKELVDFNFGSDSTFCKLTDSNTADDVEKEESHLKQVNENKVSDEVPNSSVTQEAVQQSAVANECENETESNMEVVEESQNILKDNSYSEDDTYKDKSFDTQEDRVKSNNISSLNKTLADTETDSKSCTRIEDNLTSGIYPASVIDKNSNSASYISDKIIETEISETDSLNNITENPNKDNLTSDIPPASVMDKDLNSAKSVSDKTIENGTSETDSLKSFTESQNKDNLTCSIDPVNAMNTDLNSARCISDKVIENVIKSDSLQGNSVDPCIVSVRSEVKKLESKNGTNLKNNDNPNLSTENLNTSVSITNEKKDNSITNKLLEDKETGMFIETEAKDQPQNINVDTQNSRHSPNLQNVNPSAVDVVESHKSSLVTNISQSQKNLQLFPNVNASSTNSAGPQNVTSQANMEFNTKFQNTSIDSQSTINLQACSTVDASSTNLVEPQSITSQANITQSQNTSIDSQSSINSQASPSVNVSSTNLTQPQNITLQPNNVTQSQNTSIDSQISINSQVCPSVNASSTNLAQPQNITLQPNNVTQSQNTSINTQSSINSQVFPNMNASSANLVETQNITSQANNITQSQNTSIDSQSSINSQVLPNMNASSTNFSEPLIITPQMPNPPNAVIELPLPSLPAVLMSSLAPDGTIQSNLYRFVINTPLAFNSPNVNGVCLPLTNTLPLQSTDVSSPIIVTPAPTTVPLFNVDNSANTIINPEYAENISTLSASGTPDLNSGFSHNKDENICSVVTTPSNTVKKSTKRKRSTKNNSEDLVDKNSDLPLTPSSPSPSSSTASANCKAKRRHTKRPPKRKPLSLFSSSPRIKSKTTPTKGDNSDFPVLSIPESPMTSNQSSAFKLLSQITGQIETLDKSPRFERNPNAKTLEKSPLLKALLKNAATLVEKPSRISSAHVRCLDFDTDSSVQNNKDSQTHGIKSKVQNNVSGKSAVPHRRSPRVRQTKEKEKSTESKSFNKHTNELDKNSADHSFSINQNDPNPTPMKATTKNTELSAFSKVLDVFHYEDVQILDDSIGIDTVNSNAGISPKNSPKMTSAHVAISNKVLAENNSKSHKTQKESMIENLNMPIYTEKKELGAGPQVSDSETDINEKQENFAKKSENSKKLNNSKSSDQNITSKIIQEQELSVSTCLLSVNSKLEKNDVDYPLNDSKKIKSPKISKQTENKKKLEKVITSNYKSMSYALFGSDSEFTPEKNSFSHKVSPQISLPNEGLSVNVQKKNNISSIEREKSLSDITEKKVISSPNQYTTIDCTSKHKEEIDLTVNTSYHAKSQNSPVAVIDEKPVECVKIENCFENGEQSAKPYKNVISGIRQSLHKSDESEVKSFENNIPAVSNEKIVKSINQESTPQLSLMAKISSEILGLFSIGKQSIEHCTESHPEEKITDNVNEQSIAIQQSLKTLKKPASKNFGDNLKSNKKDSVVEQTCTDKYSPKSSSSLKPKNPSPQIIGDNHKLNEKNSLFSASQISLVPEKSSKIPALPSKDITIESLSKESVADNENTSLSQSKIQKSSKTQKKLSPKSYRENPKINEKCSLNEQIDTKKDSPRTSNSVKPKSSKTTKQPSKHLSPKSNRDNPKINEKCFLVEEIDANKISPSSSNSLKPKIGDNPKLNENCFSVEQANAGMYLSKLSTSSKPSKEVGKAILTNTKKQTRDSVDNIDQTSTKSSQIKKHKSPISSPATSNTNNICNALIKTSPVKGILSKENVKTVLINSEKHSGKISYGVNQKMSVSASSTQMIKQKTPISSPIISSPSYNPERNVSLEKGTPLKFANIASENSNKEMNTVLPPPKKRIRPIPVDSLSNESFIAFTQFTDLTEIGGKTVRENRCGKEMSEKKENFKLKPDSIESKEKSKVHSPVAKNTSSVSESPNVDNLKSCSNSVPIYSDNMSPLKQFASNLQVNSPTSKTPISKTAVAKTPVTKTPVAKTPVTKTPTSLFKQPCLWKSGKPRALYDFYIKAHPDKEGDLPISPLSFSNSSCTLDGFSAKRKLIDDSPTTSVEVQQNDILSTSAHDEQKKCEIIGESLPEKDTISVEQKKIKSNTADASSGRSSEKLNPCFSSFDELKNVEENINKTSSLNDEVFEERNEDFLPKVKRKRKRSDSSLSDTCSTVVDMELELETPVKSDEWREKPLFYASPIVKKSRKICDSDYESSPEKTESFKFQQDFTSSGKTQNSLFKQKSEVLSVEQSCVNESCEVQLNDAKNISSQNEMSKTSTKPSMLPSSSIKKTNHSIISEKPTKKDAQKDQAKKQYKQSTIDIRDGSKIKEKNISPGKKERRSRPSLKIAPFKSPCKKNFREKKQISPSNFRTKKSDSTKKDNLCNTPIKTNESLIKSIKNYSKHSNETKIKLDDNVEMKTKFNSSHDVTAVIGEATKPSNQVTNLKITSVVSKKSHEVLDHCETTQDIVESDIGRSNEEGSELAIAIANCERELLMKPGTSDNLQHSGYHIQDEITEKDTKVKSYTKEKSEKHQVLVASSFHSPKHQMDSEIDKNKEITVDGEENKTDNLQIAHNSQSPMYHLGNACSNPKASVSENQKSNDSNFRSSECQMDSKLDKNKGITTVDNKESKADNLQTAHSSQSPMYHSGDGCSEPSESENQKSKVTNENLFPEEVRSDPKFLILMEKLKSIDKDKIARLFKHLIEDKT